MKILFFILQCWLCSFADSQYCKRVIKISNIHAHYISIGYSFEITVNLISKSNSTGNTTKTLATITNNDCEVSTEGAYFYYLNCNNTSIEYPENNDTYIHSVRVNGHVGGGSSGANTGYRDIYLPIINTQCTSPFVNLSIIDERYQSDLLIDYCVQCILPSCVDRTPSFQNAYCYSSFDPSNSRCYQVENGCRTSCPTNYYLVNDLLCRKWEDLDCSLRNVTSPTNPCYTANCYQQLNHNGDGLLNKCGTICPENLSTPENGICKLKGCTSRVVDSRYRFPCGSSNCFQMVGVDHILRSDCTQNCPPEYSIGREGVCRAALCPVRQAFPALDMPCATSDCFQQLDLAGSGNLSLKCGLDCSRRISSANTDGFFCELKPNCSSRTPEPVFRRPCGSTDCYQQLNTSDTKLWITKCSADCPSRNLTIANPSTGRCELIRDCSARRPDMTFRYPCGSPDCYHQPDLVGDGTLGEACSSVCPTNITYADDASGTCVWLNCPERVADYTFRLVCGDSKCFQQLNRNENGSRVELCADTCPYNISIANNGTGVCELKRCASRTVDPRYMYQCGTSDCFQQLDTTGVGMWGDTCDTDCPTNVSIPNLTTYRCDLIDVCIARTPDAGSKFPCGSSNCYQQSDPGGDGSLLPRCDMSCIGSLIKPDGETGRCVLKACVSRMVDRSYKFPCGDSLCFQQRNPDVTGMFLDTCDETCPNNQQVPNRNTGQCDLKGCPLRTPVAAYKFPCGSADCFQQLDASATRPLSEEECASTCHQRVARPNTDTGRCEVIPDCALRTADSTFRYPCGSYSCFQQPNQTTCAESCPKDYLRDPVYGVCEEDRKLKQARSVKVAVAIVVPVIVVLGVVVAAIVAAVLYVRVRSGRAAEDEVEGTGTGIEESKNTELQPGSEKNLMNDSVY